MFYLLNHNIVEIFYKKKLYDYLKNLIIFFIINAQILKLKL